MVLASIKLERQVARLKANENVAVDPFAGCGVVCMGLVLSDCRVLLPGVLAVAWVCLNLDKGKRMLPCYLPAVRR